MTAAAEFLTGYLRTLVRARRELPGRPACPYPYLCSEDFVLREGRPFVRGGLPPSVRRGVPKMCYRNCASRAGPGLLYAEGFGCANGLPCLHAWLVDPKDPGAAIDPTWTDHDDAAYYGVVFDADYARFVVLRQGASVLDNWGRPARFALQRGVVPPAVWKGPPLPAAPPGLDACDDLVTPGFPEGGQPGGAAPAGHDPEPLVRLDRYPRKGRNNKNVWYNALRCPVCGRPYTRLANTARGRRLLCDGTGSLTSVKRDAP